ncbi:hypothetical protein B0T24DRAFT_206768 [Lasiosphaeria ovina]|uniref:Uncharacterized protein n=1 Tax=Lasiosphaeria ovina TaxID=92902 RepID=A0AAE0N9J0_9PEZI|nr:hypothetical protein B0T24DRAFT_206768 [Lasiosphaeria ovina]
MKTLRASRGGRCGRRLAYLPSIDPMYKASMVGTLGALMAAKVLLPDGLWIVANSRVSSRRHRSIRMVRRWPCSCCGRRSHCPPIGGVGVSRAPYSIECAARLWINCAHRSTEQLVLEVRSRLLSAVRTWHESGGAHRVDVRTAARNGSSNSTLSRAGDGFGGVDEVRYVAPRWREERKRGVRTPMRAGQRGARQRVVAFSSAGKKALPASCKHAGVSGGSVQSSDSIDLSGSPVRFTLG